MLLRRKSTGVLVAGFASLTLFIGEARSGAEVYKLTTADVNYVRRAETNNLGQAEECAGYRAVATRISEMATAIKAEGKLTIRIATAIIAMAKAVTKCSSDRMASVQRRTKDDARLRIDRAAAAIRESLPARIAAFYGGETGHSKGFGWFYTRVIQWSMLRPFNRNSLYPLVTEVLRSMDKPCLRHEIRQWTGIPVPKCMTPVLEESMTYEQGISAVEKAILCEDYEIKELKLYLARYEEAVRTKNRFCRMSARKRVQDACPIDTTLFPPIGATELPTMPSICADIKGRTPR